MVGSGIRSALNTFNFHSVDGYGVHSIYIHIAEGIVVCINVLVARSLQWIGADPAPLGIVFLTGGEVVLTFFSTTVAPDSALPFTVIVSWIVPLTPVTDVPSDAFSP